MDRPTKRQRDASQHESFSNPTSIPDTDPQETLDLWTQVTDYVMAEHDENTGAPTSGKKAENTMGTSLFEPTIAAPRAIEIVEDVHIVKTQNVWKHFGNAQPSTSSRDEIGYYKGLPGLEDTNVWLSTSADFVEEVRNEWAALREYGLNEGEHETTAYELLLKREKRRPGVEPKTQNFIPERMIKMHIRPHPDDAWNAPPIIRRPSIVMGPDWSYVIKPDCMYWLSLQGFRHEYGSQMKDYVFVAGKRILSPYLSIEHKPDDKEYRKAKHQIVCSAALAVFNRFQLRQTTLQRRGQPWADTDMDIVRHYGLHMMGRDYGFWLIRPIISPEGIWDGCRMERLVRGQLDIESEIKVFIHWLNEIHRWGLTVHAQAVRQDIDICISEDQGNQVQSGSTRSVEGDSNNIDEERPEPRYGLRSRPDTR
ncbi:hypothetical protein B0J12DRAFT_736214 [Macrophomina phaseolina]|uniref:Uncharacterized protein n=1 Tax=Macrophomina phaseolina TaxID=35725 RepID=A0ABQ8GR82_9PEZI|nr:hypothetical protein B0J12DRAFT_736214 [Macrophomina phaseolina]